MPDELTFFTEILNLLSVQNELRWEIETQIRHYLKTEMIQSIQIAKFKSSAKVMAIFSNVIDRLVRLIKRNGIQNAVNDLANDQDTVILLKRVLGSAGSQHKCDTNGPNGGEDIVDTVKMKGTGYYCHTSIIST